MILLALNYFKTCIFFYIAQDVKTTFENVNEANNVSFMMQPSSIIILSTFLPLQAYNIEPSNKLINNDNENSNDSKNSVRLSDNSVADTDETPKQTLQLVPKPKIKTQDDPAKRLEFINTKKSLFKNIFF